MYVHSFSVINENLFPTRVQDDGFTGGAPAMQLCAPTTKLLCFQQCLAFNNFAKHFSVKLRFSSGPASQVSSLLDEERDIFLTWLEQIAGVKISDVLSIGKSTNGRSLFASDVIHTGDCMLEVPYNVCITPDELPPKIRASLTNVREGYGKLAAFLLIEKKKGHKSRWAPYISRLPPLEEMHSTALKQHFPGVFDSISLQEFMHAYALVGSRAWETPKGISLIPFADFLNHDGDSESHLFCDDDKQLSEVTADRHYSPGEEVLISYGRFSNANLLLDYGFTLPHNVYDLVHIRMDIPKHDPLRKMKLELLQSHHTRSVKDTSFYCSSWDSFSIKEVKSAEGKGKGLPQSLRAFTRVLCCTSPQELSDLSMEAAKSDGRLARLPFRESSQEVRAHQLLSSHIQKLIEDRNAHIKVLEAFDPRSISGSLGVRRRMAWDLLMGELRVLSSAATWLHNYCKALLATHKPPLTNPSSKAYDMEYGAVFRLDQKKDIDASTSLSK